MLVKKKKQYRPIAGQRWYEKVLDWITREETLRWLVMGLVAYLAIFLVVEYVLCNVLELPDVGDMFFEIWSALFPVPVVIALTNAFSGFWGISAEEKLQKPITEYLETHGYGTYSELVHHCMPIKIHLGIDAAMEQMLEFHKLVLDADDRFRLPTEEDRRRWRKEWLEDYGERIAFEDLEKRFAWDLEELGESLNIEFSLGEHDGYYMGKSMAKDSDTEVCWCITDTDQRQKFATFRELTAAKLFDGQSLEMVWDDVILTNSHDYGRNFL